MEEKSWFIAKDTRTFVKTSRRFASTLSLGLQVPSEKVLGVGLQGRYFYFNPFQIFAISSETTIFGWLDVVGGLK